MSKVAFVARNFSVLAAFCHYFTNVTNHYFLLEFNVVPELVVVPDIGADRPYFPL